jgi:hypothetical protein
VPTQQPNTQSQLTRTHFSLVKGASKLNLAQHLLLGKNQ